MEIKNIKIEKPGDLNIIIGQAHFIKTVEDLYEALAGSSTNIKFGLAFCESSGPCLVRSEGNDQALKKLAEDMAIKVGAGHSFFVIMRDAFPINVLNAIKNIPEVCSIFCATANTAEVIVAETEQGRGILGVIDGLKPRGVETDKDIKDRKDLLRKFKYKL
ncbi:MAG: adenosine monophosphate-protein transferase [Candidatus Omnitrophica bacterium]|nr:adenosine monophosphate-protein transferase [Candidatus Omnitrophota bacterium]